VAKRQAKPKKRRSQFAKDFKTLMDWYDNATPAERKRTGDQLVKIGRKKNPALLIISNPVKLKGKKVGKPSLKAVRTYKSFHMSDPAEIRAIDVPKGWPKHLIVIGDVDRLDVSNPKTGKEISKKYRVGQVKVCMATSRKELFVISMGTKKLGLKNGIALRIDYSVPPSSGRNKWAKRWWHPHDSGPKLKTERSGKAARIKGPKLKITVRGIIG